MKKINVLIVSLLCVLTIGCSSDAEEAAVAAESFHMFVNGEDIQSFYRNSDPFTYKSESEVGLDDRNFYHLSLDKNGRFGNFRIKLRVGPGDLDRTFYSHTDYSSNYFTFNLISIDENTHRIKGSFSGYVYADPFDLNSESKYVNGDFDQNYENIVPAIIGLGNHAKINGNEWKSTNLYKTKITPDNNNYITYHYVYDDAYKVMLKFNPSTIGIGTHDFAPDTDNNLIQLAKFDTITASYVNYNCTGTLNITQKESLGQEKFILSGTYTFTAVNPQDPSDVIQVTDGAIKLFYKFFIN